MKYATKIILSLSLVIVFLIACFSFIFVGMTGLFLHTYKVFTFSEPVAKVTISEQKRDDKGEYADVSLTLIEKERSALTYIFAPNDLTSDNGKTFEYKLYGDTVYLGGPMIKFKNELILLNFQTIYKVGKIYARYDLDNELEENRTPDISSTHDLNGGYADWKSVHDNFTSENILGDVLQFFIDSMQISAAGQFVSNRELSYTVFITNNGFLWRLDE